MRRKSSSPEESQERQFSSPLKDYGCLNLGLMLRAEREERKGLSDMQILLIHQAG